VGHLEQHFLCEPEALAWVVAQLDPRPGERVVELGAGSGTVAAALRTRVAASDLTLVELDPALADGLRTGFPGVRVVAADWCDAWPALAPVDLLVVSLPHGLVAEVLATALAAPPRAIVAAVAPHRPPNVPPALRLVARRPLPRTAFSPPQPFDGEAWVLRPATGSGRPGRTPPAGTSRSATPATPRGRRRPPG